MESLYGILYTEYSTMSLLAYRQLQAWQWSHVTNGSFAGLANLRSLYGSWCDWQWYMSVAN